MAINKAVDFVRERMREIPRTAIILGTGLGRMADTLKIEESIDYGDIPHFPVSTVDGHAGKLVLARMKDIPLLILHGRFHFYEGYTMQQVIFPIRVLKFLGVETLMISNAAGGMNPGFQIGDIMLITDHINLMPNPLVGPHDPAFGDRFPDMSETYDRELLQRARGIAGELEIKVQEGCYVGVTGPTLETPGEYEYMRIIGGDAVGMSTVPEAIAAHQMGIRIFAASVITDLGVPGKIVKLTLQDVLDAAERTAPQLSALFVKMVSVDG